MSLGNRARIPGDRIMTTYALFKFLIGGEVWTWRIAKINRDKLPAGLQVADIGRNYAANYTGSVKIDYQSWAELTWQEYDVFQKNAVLELTHDYS